MRQGVDVSNWNGSIDWAGLKAHGFDIAYVLATDGAKFSDKMYYPDMNQARGLGFQTGAYHFYRTSEDPKEQAEWFLRQAGWNDVWLPPVLDFETNDGKVPPTKAYNDISVWLETVEHGTGVIPIIYTGPSFWRSLGNWQDFHRHPLWIAHYGVSVPDVPGGWPAWTGWQYTSAPLDYSHWTLPVK